jgi:hypothetical protein
MPQKMGAAGKDFFAPIGGPMAQPGYSLPGVIPGPSQEAGAGALQLRPSLRYSNQYGTNAGIGYDLGSQSVQADAVFPVGDATQGNRLEMRGGYGPEGPSAYIGFRKLNVPNLSKVEAAGNAAQMDPGYAAYLEANPDKLEIVRAAQEKRMREQALGINQVGGSKYEVGFDLFGGGGRGGRELGPMGTEMAGDPRVKAMLGGGVIPAMHEVR